MPGVSSKPQPSATRLRNATPLAFMPLLACIPSQCCMSPSRGVSAKGSASINCPHASSRTCLYRLLPSSTTRAIASSCANWWTAATRGGQNSALAHARRGLRPPSPGRLGPEPPQRLAHIAARPLGHQGGQGLWYRWLAVDGGRRPQRDVADTPPMRPRSAGRATGGVQAVPIPRCGCWPWPRPVRTPTWAWPAAAVAKANRHWRESWYRIWSQTCSVWLTAISSAMSFGARSASGELNACGGSSRTCGWTACAACPMGPTWPTSIPALPCASTSETAFWSA